MPKREEPNTSNDAIVLHEHSHGARAQEGLRLYAPLISLSTPQPPEHLITRRTGLNAIEDLTQSISALMAEREEELKRLLMKVKEENEKAGLKLNIQRTKIIASNPITSWQIDGKKVETAADFILGGSKITRW